MSTAMHGAWSQRRALCPLRLSDVYPATCSWLRVRGELYEERRDERILDPGLWGLCVGLAVASGVMLYCQGSIDLAESGQSL